MDPVSRVEYLVEVGVGEGGELLLDGLEQADGDVEAGLGAMRQLGVVLHGAEGATALGAHIEGACGVPPACRSLAAHQISASSDGEDLGVDDGHCLCEAEHEWGAVLLGEEDEVPADLEDGPRRGHAEGAAPHPARPPCAAVAA